ncbi:MAG: hypothetical protein Q9191_001222 [Dirinaria sp. TL-2023a]
MSDASFTIRTAFDMITRIAVEPIVARYVRYADFKVDSFFTRHRPRECCPDVHCGGAVVKLFADSPYLEQAGLDWQEYYAKIEEDLQGARYSQHAAAFLLTLLPNLKTLNLPQRWKPLSSTDKLVDTVVRKARQSQLLLHNTPSLAQTTRFEPSTSLGSEAGFDMAWASPFLALPLMWSFHGLSCIALDDGGHESTYTPKDLYGGPFGEVLEEVRLGHSCIDEVGIASFLKHMKRLRTLLYSHSTKGNGGTHNGDWDICKFLSAIEHEAGSHLEVLSVSIRDLRGSVTPGRVSMRSFQRLRKLELPLEAAMCNITAASASRAATTTGNSPVVGDSSTEHHYMNSDEPFIRDLVPASVSQLSLISAGTDDHATVLELMFRGFVSTKQSTLSALEQIHLVCPADADDAYKEQCASLHADTEKAGVVVHLYPCPDFVTAVWDEDW